MPHRPQAPGALQQLVSGLLLGSAPVGGATPHHVDAAAYALLDAAKTSTYALVCTFGPLLTGMLTRATPWCGEVGAGTPASAAKLLATLLAQEH